MARVHPKTWEDGVMPLAEFPDEHREQIERAVAAEIPPPRWIRLGAGQIESRAWHEWHWARGRRLRAIESPRPARKRIPPEVRGEVYARDGFACLHCGATGNLTIDHIYPWSLGGSDEIENLQTLCRPCNSRKGAKVDAS